MTSFGGFFVPPNPIAKPTLESFKHGWFLLAAVCVVFSLYFIVLIWARRADRADLIKVILYNPY